MFIPIQNFPNQHHGYLEDGEAGLEEVIKGSSRCVGTKFATKQLRMRILRLKDREEKAKDLHAKQSKDEDEEDEEDEQSNDGCN